MKSDLKSALLSSIFILIAATAHTWPQSSIDWQTITVGYDDFSLAIPSGYLVHKDPRGGAMILVGSANGVSYEARFQKTSDGRRWLASADDITIRGKRTEYVIGDALVHLFTYQGSKIFRASVTTATKNGYYHVSLSAPSADSDVLTGILASLQLAGKAMVKSPKVEAPNTSSVRQVNNLEPSEIVKAALKRKHVNKKFPVEIAPADFKPEDKEIIYSRRLMVLYKVPATYNDEARTGGVQGTVRVRVLFKGDGTIGKVTILKGLSHGLNNQVIQAIRRIKFLPAEVDGVPADAEQTLEYTFSIY